MAGRGQILTCLVCLSSLGDSSLLRDIEAGGVKVAAENGKTVLCRNTSCCSHRLEGPGRAEVRLLMKK